MLRPFWTLSFIFPQFYDLIDQSEAGNFRELISPGPGCRDLTVKLEAVGQTSLVWLWRPNCLYGELIIDLLMQRSGTKSLFFSAEATNSVLQPVC